jgi:peroxiredoxin
MNADADSERQGEAHDAVASPADVSHLAGLPLPDIALPSTTTLRAQSLDQLSRGATYLVVYAYPALGAPDRDLLTPDWMHIPGAFGCTAESCSFRDLNGVLRDLGAQVCGLSTQSSAEQHEAAERLSLNFPLLSDANHAVCKALSLPQWPVSGRQLLKRFTMVAHGPIIEHVFAPVGNPSTHADNVAAWLRQQTAAQE